uniref:Uncharacterized protein n=1 Tax=Anguilla anguilla TaxID=7936 RepID=A0A0E9UQM9_ANGAN
MFHMAGRIYFKTALVKAPVGPNKMRRNRSL